MPEMPPYDATKVVNDIGDMYTIEAASEKPEFKAVPSAKALKALKATDPDTTAVKVVGFLVPVIMGTGRLIAADAVATSNRQWVKGMKQETETESPTELSRVICTNETKKFFSNMQTKIIDFKLMSNEDVIIAERPIACKVYQVDRITLSKEHSGSDDFIINKFLKAWMPGSTRVMNDSAKVWISNEVPFGIVKGENKTSFLWQDGRKVYKHDSFTSFEVTEFNY